MHPFFLAIKTGSTGVVERKGLFGTPPASMSDLRLILVTGRPQNETV
jgi:hypothetical protein